MAEHSKSSSIVSMPSEILLHIFTTLCNDTTQDNLRDTLACELVCKNWQNVLTYNLWKKLCQKLLLIQSARYSFNYSNLKPTFVQHEDEFEHRSKEFYLKLLNLHKRWCLIQDAQSSKYLSPTVKKINTNMPEWNCDDQKSCEATEHKVLNRWRTRHNYSGVYDMVYVKEKGILVASVDGKIQVWNVSGGGEKSQYFCQNVLNASMLDFGGNDIDMVTCFYVTDTGKTLVCGTENARLKLFDLCTPGGKLMESHWVNGTIESASASHMPKGKNRLSVSDVRIRADTLMALDWLGKLHEWKIESRVTNAESGGTYESLVHIRSFLPNFGPLRDNWDDEIKTWWHFMNNFYNKRYCERLLDFCAEAILVTKDKLLCILPRNPNMSTQSAVWIETNHSILSCKIFLNQTKEMPDKSSKGRKEIIVLCGQQQGYLLRYEFNGNLFASTGSLEHFSEYVYMKPQYPNISSDPAFAHLYTHRYIRILHSDMNIGKKGGALESLHTFQTFYKSPVTSITVQFLPRLTGEGITSQAHVIIGDRDGEIYILDGVTLVTKFHMGFRHSHFSEYDAIPSQISSCDNVPQQGITYDIRGRMREDNEQECIIWSVKADASRIFSGDSNGGIVVHDFWKYNPVVEKLMSIGSMSNDDNGTNSPNNSDNEDQPLNNQPKRCKLNNSQ